MDVWEFYGRLVLESGRMARVLNHTCQRPRRRTMTRCAGVGAIRSAPSRPTVLTAHGFQNRRATGRSCASCTRTFARVVHAGGGAQDDRSRGGSVSAGATAVSEGRRVALRDRRRRSIPRQLRDTAGLRDPGALLRGHRARADQRTPRRRRRTLRRARCGGKGAALVKAPVTVGPLLLAFALRYLGGLRSYRFRDHGHALRRRPDRAGLHPRSTSCCSA